MSGAWKYDRRIQSDPNLCPSVIEDLVKKLTEFGWTTKDIFGIHMAMEEAIINAIKHGNDCCPDSTVHIQVELDDQQFCATVTDQGRGFDMSDVPDPTQVENLEKNCGRGVMLIQHFVDEAQYNEQGNSVCLKKQKSN